MTVQRPPVSRTFVGFLANVDRSILGVDFSEGTVVERIPFDDAMALVAELERMASPLTAHGHLISIGCIDRTDNSAYVVRGQLGGEAPTTGEVSLVMLNSKLRLARLFHPGNLVMPLEYIYVETGGRKVMSMWGRGGAPVEWDPFTLTPEEIPRLNEFLRSNTIPFGRPFVDLSFRTFELSYSALGIGLPFLALWSGVESLLNLYETEIGYRLSRGVASLLARNSDEFASIRAEIKGLYKLRSRFIHGGDETEISVEELRKLRGYVRRCIIRVKRLGIEKEALLELLDSVGFGPLPDPE